MAATLNVVDSSAWLAYLADEPGAAHFAPAVEDTRRLVVPSICLLEVFKIAFRQKGESDALSAVALMQEGTVVDLDARLAVVAATLGLAHKLPLADSVVYAVARRLDAVLWTQDEDFKGLPGVRYFARGRR